MTDKNRTRIQAFCRFAIVYTMLFICAGNITNSFLLKWGFRDDPKGDLTHSFSFVAMMDGTAPKPFVYRSSFPRAAKWLVERLDQPTQDKLFKTITRHDSLRDAYFSDLPRVYWTAVVAITYHLVYIAIVLSMLFASLIVYKLARMHQLGFGQSIGFLAGFSFIYPLTFQQGGYYYDFFEILGVLGACYFVLKRRMLVCTLWTVLFSLNKETFFLAPCALFFLHEREVGLRRRLAWLTLQLAICMVTRQYIMAGYAENAGGFALFHLWNNIKFWLEPSSYLQFTNLVGKGIFTPCLQNPLMLVPLAVFFRSAWQGTPTPYRRYFFAGFIPLFFLFMCFGYRDEARNFSLLFPAIILIALHGAKHFSEIFGGDVRTPGSRVAGDGGMEKVT